LKLIYNPEAEMDKRKNNKIAVKVAKEIHPALNIHLDLRSEMSESEIKELVYAGLGTILAGSK